MIDIYNTKQELTGYGVKKRPLSFIGILETIKTTRGSNDNKKITVYVTAKDGTPYRLGETTYCTASCIGESGEANQVVKAVYGYKMKDSYRFKDGDIQVHIL